MEEWNSICENREAILFIHNFSVFFFSITWQTHKERLHRPSSPVLVYPVGSSRPSFVILLECHLAGFLIVFYEMMLCSYLAVTYLELINIQVIVCEHLCLLKGKKLYLKIKKCTSYQFPWECSLVFILNPSLSVRYVVTGYL